MRGNPTQCALDTCSQPLPPLAAKMGDPFHSAACCRAFHGLVFENDKIDRTLFDESEASASTLLKRAQRADPGFKDRENARRRERNREVK